MNQDVLTLLKTRRSFRAYKPDPVPEDLLDAVLEAGTYAPSAMGQQSATIVAVRDPETRAALTAMNAKVFGRDMDPYYGAPVIVLVFAKGPNATADGSCVLENLMLAAHASGLGSCWINREREMFATPEGKALMVKWGLDEELQGVGAISLGYPGGDPKPAAPRKPGYIVKV